VDKFLQPLLAPGSLALLGASPRPDSFGKAMFEMAMSGGFNGRIFAVNPNYDEINGVSCYPTLDAMPAMAEHVVLGLANERIEQGLQQAIDHGAKAATIFADCSDAAMRSRIREMAKQSGILLGGPNAMGFHNLDIGLRVTPFPAPVDIQAGGIAAILQSGSVMGALVHNDTRLRFNLLVSSGSEFNVTAADYLLWAVEQPTTKVVGMFLESVRDPSGLLGALTIARKKNIPVVILKVGRTETSRKMAASHTGAIIGNHSVFRTVMRDAGAHLVDSIDELAASLHLFSQARPVPNGAMASIHDSGGERELLADIADDLDVPLAKLNHDTVERIAAHLEPGLKAENPLDAWGSGKSAEATFESAFQAMMEDQSVAVGLYVLDWREHYYLHEMHTRALIQVAKKTRKPVAAVSNYSLSHDRSLAQRLADHGIPLLKGTREALKACKQLFDHRDFRFEPPIEYQPHGEISKFKQDLAGQHQLTDAAGFELLSAYGIRTPSHVVVHDRVAAAQAAERLGYPVVLKTANPAIAHKSEVHGVRLHLRNESEVKQSYDDIAARLGSEVLVCQMIDGDMEWIIGMINDRDFGPAVMISPGGVMVELLDERVILMAPFDANLVAEKLLKLRATRLLTGYRGRDPLAFDALCETAANLSRLVIDLQQDIKELDINPLLMSDRAAIAVDVLIRT
jgi:acyl-CoA synthetase (NDP forming)